MRLRRTSSGRENTGRQAAATRNWTGSADEAPAREQRDERGRGDSKGGVLQPHGARPPAPYRAQRDESRGGGAQDGDRERQVHGPPLPLPLPLTRPAANGDWKSLRWLRPTVERRGQELGKSLRRRSIRDQEKGPVSGAFEVAGAGFEPATSGL
jgi:hypothetical protein